MILNYFTLQIFISPRANLNSPRGARGENGGYWNYMHGWVGTRTGPGQETVDNVVNPGVANLANTMVGCHQDGDRNAENKMKLVVRLKRMAECGRRTEMGSRIWL